jgi:hypothetical protein
VRGDDPRRSRPSGREPPPPRRQREREEFGNLVAASGNIGPPDGVRALLTVSTRSPRSHPPGESAVRRFTHNAFHVLDLPVDASAADVRRQAARLVDRLVNSDPGAGRYDTPVGPRVRDAAMVQRAATQLRDPDERVQHEIWAAVPRRDATPRAVLVEGSPGWPGAPAAFGWRRR